MRVYLTILFFSAGVFISSAQTNATITAGEHMMALPPADSSPAPAATNDSSAPATTNAPDATVATNTPAASSATNAPARLAREKVTINSDVLQADFAHRVTTYRDHVSVTGDQWKMTCEWLMANLPEHGEHITNIVAQTNVVGDFQDEKNQRWHVTGDLGVYAFHILNGVTNETVTLWGNPARIEEGPDTNTMVGNVIIYNLMTKFVTMSNVTSTFFTGTNSPTGTNSLGPNINPL